MLNSSDGGVRMRRRDFAKTLALASGFITAPILVKGSSLIANSFKEEDTLSERIRKFNVQTGSNLVLMYRHTFVWKSFGLDFAKNDPCRGDTITLKGSEVYQDQETGLRFWLEEDGKHFTGDMTAHEMFHWTAQVALGYRMAKNQ